MSVGADRGREVQDLLDAIATRDERAVAALVDAGVDVNARGPEGETPLVTAAATGDLAILERLLEAEADPNLADDEGNVPLAYALMSQEPAAARALLRAGARADASPALLSTAAAHAATETVEALLERGADPNIADPEGRTPLLAACAAGRLETAALLLARGADARARDRDGTTTLLALLEGVGRSQLLPDFEALRRLASGSIDGFRPIVAEAVAHGKSGEQAEELTLPGAFETVFSALLRGGARVDAVDEIGRNALAIAVCEGYPAWVVAALLGRGADPRKADDDGLTAADFADLHPSADVRSMLGR